MTADVAVRLPLDLYSPEQLSAIIIELRGHISSLRDASVRAKASHTATSEPVHTSALLLGVLRESGVSPTDQPADEKLLKELEAIRNKAPAVHLMMAALPNRDLKRKLTDWFRAEIHPYTLLTFAVRADIGGGVIVQAGSHVYNWSFREQILNHKSRISEIYHSVRQ
jgi:hypothetical protein